MVRSTAAAASGDQGALREPDASSDRSVIPEHCTQARAGCTIAAHPGTHLNLATVPAATWRWDAAAGMAREHASRPPASARTGAARGGMWLVAGEAGR
jgi:hypothetical protein